MPSLALYLFAFFCLSGWVASATQSKESEQLALAWQVLLFPESTAIRQAQVEALAAGLEFDRATVRILETLNDRHQYVNIKNQVLRGFPALSTQCNGKRSCGRPPDRTEESTFDGRLFAK